MTSQLESPSLPSAVAAEHTFLQIPSQPEWIAPTVEFLKHKAMLCGVCHEARASKLMLALHEALTNSLVHGNLGLSSDLKERSDNAFAEALAQRAADPLYAERAIEVGIDYDGERCRWTITDQGNGFDVGRALARAEMDEPDAFLASGRGIMLMRAFLDDVRYELGGRRAVLTLARPSGEEKRRAPRLPVQRPIRVAPLDANGVVDWDAAQEAVTQNLSAEGIALLQNRLSTSGRVLLGIDWQGQMIYLPAEVRHWQARGDDMVELGCRFQLAPPVRDPAAATNGEVSRAIDALLEQLNGQSVRSDDRRAHPRAAFTARITVEMGPDRPSVLGFGRDLSKGGVAFVTSTPLPLGNVTLALPQQERPPLRVMARIVRCAQLMAGIYDVGARFLDVAHNGH